MDMSSDLPPGPIDLHVVPLRADDLAEGITLITGTDTDAGKTVATASIAAWLQRRGVEPVVCKAAQTGMAPGEPGDLAMVGRLAGIPEERLVEFSRLPEPLAPTTAAHRAGVRVPGVDEVARRISHLAAGHRSVLVEGAGGLLVGLDNRRRTIVDLAAELVVLGHTPRVVVVTRPGLGTLNHTELTLRVLCARLPGLPVGLVVGSWPARPDLAERCNLEELPGLAPVLAVLPAGIGEDPAAVADSFPGAVTLPGVRA